MILINAKKNILLIVLKNIFFKHVSNNDYGKAMENFRKRINARLVNNAKGYEKYGSKSKKI